MVNETRQVFGCAALGLAAVLAAGCSRNEPPPPPAVEAAPVVVAPPSEISIPGTGVFPESLTSASDGTIYIGSVGKAEVYRVAPGAAAAEPFIAPGTGGMKQVFGVFADDASGTLWVCSNDLGGGAPGAKPGASALHSFELATGAAKSSYALPKGGFCNDTAVAANGDLYATDTNGMQVLKLSKGGTALQVWSKKGAFGPAGGILDGIAVVGERVIVNTLLTSKLFAVEIGADGKAGAVKELQMSAALTRPDGMRAYGTDGLLVTDGSGKIQHVVINGDAATVTTLKDGLDGVVAVTVVGKMAYALEGQLAIMMGPPDGEKPVEKPYHAVGFTLP
jgi:sugar lactone lactonase YvrE